MKKVTVIVPVYNVEKYLTRCLNSLMEQTYKNYEVICIDDCSPDNSKNILANYADKYPNILRIIKNQKNIGQGRSRICAVKQAEGDYIMFVDSDDYVATDYIERFMAEVEKKDYDVVIAGYTRDVNETHKQYNVANSPWTLVCQPTVWARLFRKNFILENGIDFSEARMAEDIYFSISVFYQDVKYKIIQYYGYYYCLNKTSTTRKITYDKNLESVISHMFHIFLLKFPLEKLPEKKKRMIEYTYVCNMINALITYGHGCKPHIMRKKYHFFIEDMSKKFPDYRHNPYFGLWRPKEVNRKIRIGVGTTMLLHKAHLDALLFWIISWI